MDYESADSRSKGCWDPAGLLTPFYEKWTSESATPEFVVDETWCGMVGSVGFGAFATAESGAFWKQTLQEVYRGDEGRRKVRMALNCLIERDGLLLRLRDIQCPVYWLQVRTLTTSTNCTAKSKQCQTDRPGHRRHAVWNDRCYRADQPFHAVQGGQTADGRGGLPLPQRYPPRARQSCHVGHGAQARQPIKS